ncbi:MAG: sensor histidine kinase [Desulfurivibrio sp.]
MIPHGPLIVFLIYLFYGAAFFAIGVAIISRLKTFATLRIAGLFWLLAVFAFSHAMHEWLEMFLFLEQVEPFLALRIRYLSMMLLAGSFLFLYLFGVNLLRAINPRNTPWLLGLLAVATIIFLLRLHDHSYLPAADFLKVVDQSTRRLFAIPATLLTGSGFLLYARRLRALSRQGAGNFTGAGLAFLAYGVFTGLIPSNSTLLQLPIQFWRGLTAFVILHFIMYALDIFWRERDAMLNKRLQQAARVEKLSAIGRLAAGIAHEINNPLANASLQLELLQRDPAVNALPEKSLQRLQHIAGSVEKSSRIATELLHLTGRHQLTTAYEPVVLQTALATAWRELAAGHNHHLENLLPPALAIYGLGLKLEQLFRNLLENALDAMPAEGTVTVTGREEEGKIVVEVLDQGEGVAGENRQQVLEPFFTTKEVGKGTGLGLAICHAIMAQHDGTLELNPRSDQRGTAVTLTFPASIHRRGRPGKPARPRGIAHE